MKERPTYLFTMICLLCFTGMSAETDTIINKRAVKKDPLKSRIHNPPLVLKTSPTAFFWGGTFPFTSEYRLMAEISSGKRQSEQLGVSYLGTNFFTNQILKAAGAPRNYLYKSEGWRVQFAHKFFWIGRRHYAPFGFYFGPMISYANARVSLGRDRFYRDVYFDIRHFNINGIIGIQAGKVNRVTFDIYVGLGYKKNLVFYHPNSYQLLPYDTKEFGEAYNSNLNGVFGINIGYAL